MRSIESMSLEDLLRAYTAGIIGLLVDWVPEAVRKGAEIREGSAGRSYVLVGRSAYPVLCGDIVPVQTEDGPSDGRCGKPVRRDGACEWHAEEQARWRDLSEWEKAAAERQEEEYAA